VETQKKIQLSGKSSDEKITPIVEQTWVENIKNKFLIFPKIEPRSTVVCLP